MPRVLHVVPYLASAAGGPPVVVERLADHAAALGWQTHVISTPAMSMDGGAALQKEAEGRYQLTLLSSQMASLGRSGWLELQNAAAHADVVHLHTNWSALNLVVAWACRTTDTPYVLSPHGMLDPWSLGEKPIKKRLYLAALERRIIDNAAAIAFTTREERDLAARAIGNHPNSVVIALGADVPPLPLDILRSRFQAEYPDLAKRPIILFLGRLHPKKRPETAIAAMPEILRHVPEAALVFVGSGEAAFEDALRAQSAAAGLDAHVTFLGALHGAAKWAALASAELFVLPSRQENFGIAVAEALHAALPVLITRQVNICDDVVNAGAGLELREEALTDDLARHAVQLLISPSRRSDMAGKAQELASRAYTWPMCAGAMCSLYQQLILNKRAGSGHG